MAVGRILPLRENEPLAIRFVTAEATATRLGNFVYFVADGQKVLCRVVDRTNLEIPSSHYFSEPSLHPDELARFIGKDDQDLAQFVVTATILGSKIDGSFRMPRMPAPVGEQIFLAEPEYLQDCINKVSYGTPEARQTGGLHVGQVLDRHDDVKVILDADAILSTHAAVLAATGQGKSYTTGVILEELLMSHQRHPILVFDFHNEYGAMVDAKQKLATSTYQPQVEVRTEKTIQIPFGELELDDILGLMPGLTDNMVGVVAHAYRDWCAAGIRTRDAFKQRVEALQNLSTFHETSVAGVIRRFQGHVMDKPYLADGQGEDLQDLIRPGTMTILNLSDLGDLDQEGICNVIMRLVLKARRLTKTGQLDGRPFFELPYPILLVVEEAHRIAPPGNEKRSTRTLATILSEGRKFGVGAIIVTQRPGKVDGNVLSQCLSQIVSRITNPIDQDNIRQSAESATTDLMALLSVLGRGEAVIFGHAIATPVVASIRTRITGVGGDHGSPSKDALRAHSLTEDVVRPKVGAMRPGNAYEPI